MSEIITPDTGSICELTSRQSEKQRERGEVILPCIVEIEFHNDYCWLIRYKDSDQCNMIKKDDERYFFKSI